MVSITAHKTFFEMLSLYKQKLELKGNSTYFKHLKTALIRFTIPGWGGAKPQSARLSQEEIFVGIEFLKSIDATYIRSAIETQQKVFNELNVSNQSRRLYKHHLKAFVDWVEAEGYLSHQNNLEENPKKIEKKGKQKYEMQHRFRCIGYTYRDSIKKLTDWTNPEVYRLGVIEGDYINPTLQAEFENFDVYMRDVLKCKSQETRKRLTITCLCFLLGFLHRVKRIPLAELKFSLIIPVQNLDPDVRSFASYDDYLKAKIEAGQSAKLAAEKVVGFLYEYWNWRHEESRELAYKTRNTLINAVIRLAKYQYRDQTDRNFNSNFEDVPIIQRLKVLNKDMEDAWNHIPTIEPEKKMVPWPEVREVLECLRKEADLTERWRYSKKNNKDYSVSRTNRSIAHSLQDFLIIAFFTLIPPDRQRTFRELEFGRTLRNGIFLNNKFIFKEKMKDPSAARWFIMLDPDDYKTGQTYKYWHSELPDTCFPDGKTFYQYLDRWFYPAELAANPVQEWVKQDLYNQRAVLNPLHPYCFTRKVSNKQFTESKMHTKVTRVFERFKLTSMGPHMLRHSFTTYLDEINATDEERKSAAYWMHNSVRTQEEVYTHTKQEIKLRAGIHLMERINNVILTED